MAIYDPNNQSPGISPGLADIYGNDALTQFLQGPNAQQPSMGIPAPQAATQSINPQTQPMLSALTNPQQGGDINIDGWKPHHTTALGKIADIGLALLGIPALPFTKHVQRENMKEAMEGFTTDPLNSIRRMAQIPGMQDKAWSLYEDYQQLHKNDAEDAQKLQYYKDMNTDRVSGIISSYLGGINRSSHPEDNYQKIAPRLRALAAARGMDQDQINTILPDKYDPDLANTVMIGGIKPEDQAKIAETSSYHRTQAQLRQEEIDQTGTYRGARLGQLSQHEQAYENHNMAMETIASTRNARLAASKGGPSYVNTKYGPGEVAPNGNVMRIQVGNVNHFYTKVGNNKWKHVKMSPIDTTKDPSTLSNGYDGPDSEDDSDEDDN